MEKEIYNDNELNEKQLSTNQKEEKTRYVQELIELIKQKLNKEKTLVIDRFEGDFAVCEDRETR